MGFLEGSLAQAIYTGFKGKLLSGLIRQYSEPSSGALDAYGDPIDLSPTDTTIEGFTENYDDAYRARAGIPETDIKVNFFAKSAPGIVPTKDDIIKLTNNSVDHWYQVRRAQTDPATALWVCQAFAIEAPV